jgi:regulatory protein
MSDNSDFEADSEVSPAADSADSSPEVTLVTVREKAIDLLSRREHSRAELQDKLRRRDYPHDLITEVLNECVANNYQSDERFAESFVRARVNRGYGEMKIRAELQARGIGSELMGLAVEASDVDWKANAEEALKKKFLNAALAGKRTENVRDRKFRGKMQRFLQNRGYNPDQIISAVNRLADCVDAEAEHLSD